MDTVELTVRRGRESERLATALYRFAELKLSSADEIQDHVRIVRSETAGDLERRTIALWSQDAARDFITYWRSFPALRPVNGGPY